MSGCLSKYDYDIIKPYKKEKRSILEQFEEMLDNCSKTDTVIFYFSGHGVLCDGELCLALNENVSKISHRIRMTDITYALRESQALYQLVILDCCHAGAASEELKLNLSDVYLILTASERLEKAKEIDDFQASFLTYQIHQALTHPPTEICINKHIRVSVLADWLRKTAKQYNLNSLRQVPLPKLVGNEGDGFEIARCENLALTDESPRILAHRLLGELLLSQFRDVLFLYDVPEEYLSINAPQTIQINELIKYAHQKEGESLTKLLEVINQVMPK